jgi:tetratricopeptide (TPR) repeat protein
LSGARAGNFLGITAEHYAHADDFPNAIEFYARAAEHARNGFVHESVLSYVAHALNLLDAVKTGDCFDHFQFRQRWRLLDVRESTWRLQGRRDAQRADQDAMQAVANVLKDKKLMAELANRRAQLAILISDFQTQEAIARTAIELANDAADVELRLKSQRVLSTALAGQGDAHAALELTRSGLSQAREHGLRRLEGSYLSDLSNMLFNQGQIVASMELISQVLVINQEVGDRINEANNVGNRGVSWLQFGVLNEARVDIEAALGMSRAVGDRTSEGAHLANLSRLMLMQGQETLALVHARAAMDIAVATEAAAWEVISLIYVGNAELALGRVADAALAYHRAESIAQKIGNAWRFDAVAGLARVALEEGDMDEAMRLVTVLLEQMESARALEEADLPRWIELTCYKVLEAASDPRAQGVLATSHDLLLKQADNIPDAALRQSFLGNIPEHRKIVALRSQLPRHQT